MFTTVNVAVANRGKGTDNVQENDIPTDNVPPKIALVTESLF